MRRLFLICAFLLALVICAQQPADRCVPVILTAGQSNGDIRKRGSVVGKVESNGDIRKNGSIIGKVENLTDKYQAAVMYFFDFFVLEPT